MNLPLGLGLAVGSSGLVNTSFFLQHRAANELGALSARRPLRALWTLFSDRAWLTAYGAGWAGWGLYIVALRFAPLSLVQASAAGGLGLLALLSRAFGIPLAGREQLAAAASVLGLALVCASLTVTPVGGRARLVVVVVIIVLGLLAAAVIGALGRERLHPGSALGVASGLCYAVGDVATKGAVTGQAAVLAPVLIVCSLAGFALLQLALQRGTVLATAGLSSLVTGSLPIAVGIVAFGEHLPAGLAGWSRGLGFALCVAGAVLLAGIGRAAPEAAVAAHGGGLPAASR